MRPGNAERIEDVDRVVGLPEVVVALLLRRDLRWRVAAGGVGDAAERAGQRVDLPGPGSVVGGELADDQRGRTGPGRLGVEAHSVRRGYVGHGRSFLSCRCGRTTVPAGWCHGWRGASARSWSGIGTAGEWQGHVWSSISITVIVGRHGRLRQVRRWTRCLNQTEGVAGL